MGSWAGAGTSAMSCAVRFSGSAAVSGWLEGPKSWASQGLVAGVPGPTSAAA